MTTHSKNSEFESDQETSLTHATPVTGGDMPDKRDVIKSVNARGAMRHETSGDKYADLGVLPTSGGESLDKSGIKDQGYLVKKGTPFGVTAHFNSLPPGTDINDQEVADIRVQEMSTYKGGISFPGDGWT
jgi:hypothetical protein